MSAVPKKKLCWNCEGSVSRQIENCPYCGVYLHTFDSPIEALWKPSQEETIEEVPKPLYQISDSESSSQEQGTQSESHTSGAPSISWKKFSEHFQQELFPILFLMAGSICLLFGIVLTLFSHDGILTLVWKQEQGYFFLLFALPLLLLGWKFFSDLPDA